MHSAAIEGSEAFADLPTWLCAAMYKAELTTDTVTFDARVDTSSLKYEFSPNSDFFNKITGGVYRFMDTTMTTCTSDDYATCLIAKGDDVIFSVDYYYTSVEDYGLSEEDSYPKKLPILLFINLITFIHYCLKTAVFYFSIIFLHYNFPRFFFY